VTVLEVIQRSSAFLEKKGVDSPRLQTELLLAHVLNLPRLQLYLNFERPLTPVELDNFREFIRRRGQREPLQHIVGSTSFCGLEFKLQPGALIPRPETEILAEQGWLFLNQRAQTGPPPTPDSSTLPHSLITVLDFGTGSGCLSVTLAAKCPAMEGYALDISTAALELARHNALQHGVAGRIHFLESNGFAGLPPDARFDLVMSNPPYIPTAEIEQLEPEVRDHDPRCALDGGADGLNYFRLLANQTGRLLKPAGKIMLEFGDGQAESIKQIFEREKWVVETILDDYTHRPRIFIGHWN
jgi:release factor glutamine methyltransferase